MVILRWGIAAGGKISHDFVNAVGTLPANEHKVVSIAASNGDRAKQFAELHEIPTYYEGYEKLAKDSNVDVVYIGTLNPQHYQVAILMLNNGKHVLCEKPLCMNEKQVAKLFEVAKSKNLFIMEAVWSRYLPSYQYVKKLIDTGVLGEIQEVNVSFGFPLSSVDRMKTKSLGGGTILDLGIYTIQVTQFAFREPPTSIKANGELNSDGVDLSMEGELTFSGGRKAKIATSAIKQLENTAVIKGTKGEVTLHNFWCCDKLTEIDGTEKTWTFPKAKHEFNFMNSCGLRYEAEEVKRCIDNNMLESDNVSHNESLTFARIEDEIRKQIGVSFPEDNQTF